jgi:hypothetical protein
MFLCGEIVHSVFVECLTKIYSIYITTEKYAVINWIATGQVLSKCV